MRYRLLCRVTALGLIAALLLGGCSAAVGDMAERVSVAVDEIEVGGIDISDVGAEIKKYHKQLTGAPTSFSVEATDKAAAYSLVIKDLYLTEIDNFDLKIIPAESGAKVTVECPEDLLDEGLSVLIEDGTISITGDPKKTFSADDLSITIEGLCDDINIASGLQFDINASGAKDFKLEIAGAVAGKVRGLDADAVELELAGAASIDLIGETDNLLCNLNGTGSVGARELSAKDAEVTISGAGMAELTVSELLVASINGAGKISYYGDPTVERTISGIGTVKQAKE